MLNTPFRMHKFSRILTFQKQRYRFNMEKEAKISRKTIGLYQQQLLHTGLGFRELPLAKDQQLGHLINQENTDVPEDAYFKKV